MPLHVAMLADDPESSSTWKSSLCSSIGSRPFATALLFALNTMCSLGVLDTMLVMLLSQLVRLEDLW